MFIYSVRASTIRFFSVVALTLALLVGMFFIGASGDDSVGALSSSINFSGVKSNEDRLSFIEQFGIKVKGEAVEEEGFRIPENFDRVVAGYNEIQKLQGLDLSKYKNKKITRYTYEAIDYKDTKESVFVNLLIYKGTVIGCDVSSSDPGGFVEPLIKI